LLSFLTGSLSFTYIISFWARACDKRSNERNGTFSCATRSGRWTATDGMGGGCCDSANALPSPIILACRCCYPFLPSCPWLRYNAFLQPAHGSIAGCLVRLVLVPSHNALRCITLVPLRGSSCCCRPIMSALPGLLSALGLHMTPFTPAPPYTTYLPAPCTHTHCLPAPLTHTSFYPTAAHLPFSLHHTRGSGD